MDTCVQSIHGPVLTAWRSGLEGGFDRVVLPYPPLLENVNMRRSRIVQDV